MSEARSKPKVNGKLTDTDIKAISKISEIKISDAKNGLEIKDAKMMDIKTSSFPDIKTITVSQANVHIGQSVKIQGWVHGFRVQGGKSKLVFIDLRDGTFIDPHDGAGMSAFILQCILSIELYTSVCPQGLARENL